jgi:hypothetical protein
LLDLQKTPRLTSPKTLFKLPAAVDGFGYRVKADISCIAEIR